MRVSGKRFEIETIPAGDNEPAKMVASEPLPNATKLQDGLRKLLECENKQS